MVLAVKCRRTRRAGGVAQGVAVGAAGLPLNVQCVHAALGQQCAAVGGVGVGHQGQLPALGFRADRHDQRLVRQAAHQRQRGGKIDLGQGVQAQLHHLGSGVCVGGRGQRAQGTQAAGKQRHNDTRCGGVESQTAKGQHKNHPLGAVFSILAQFGRSVKQPRYFACTTPVNRVKC